MNKYFAEFFGTLILTLVVIATVFNASGWPVAAIVGLALVVLVLTIGSVSGAHVNPAITLGALSIGKISKKDALSYIACQLLGGLAALLISKAFGQVIPTAVVGFSTIALLAEVIGTMVFAFGVASAMHKGRGEAVTALLVGGSLMIGAFIAGGFGSYGIVNPAIALGLHVWGIAYLVGPLVGGVLGMWIYRLMHAKRA